MNILDSGLSFCWVTDYHWQSQCCNLLPANIWVQKNKLSSNYICLQGGQLDQLFTQLHCLHSSQVVHTTSQQPRVPWHNTGKAVQASSCYCCIQEQPIQCWVLRCCTLIKQHTSFPKEGLHKECPGSQEYTDLEGAKGDEDPLLPQPSTLPWAGVLQKCAALTHTAKSSVLSAGQRS